MPSLQMPTLTLPGQQSKRGEQCSFNTGLRHRKAVCEDRGYLRGVQLMVQGTKRRDEGLKNLLEANLEKTEGERMKVTTKHERTVLNLIQGRDGGDMRVNHEYQRGLRWTKRQKELFLDSVARGYPIPAFYLHKKTRESSFDGLTQVTYEVVDGQQRIEALWEFWKGAYKMPNPGRDTGLPASIQRQECGWAGKGWGELDKEVQERILETRVVIHECETDDPNEMRDLFIRLQAGTPLSRQDKRDAWPGGFTEFVLQQAGKSQLPQYPGEPLWKRLTGGESARRQSMAQVYMQWESMRRTGKTCDHGANAIDAFYHKNVDFEGRQEERQAFMSTCRMLEELLAARKTKLSVYMLLHSLLFVEAIKGTHVVPSGGTMVGAMKEFENRLREGRAADRKGKATPMWYSSRSSDSTHGQEATRGVRLAAGTASS